MCTPWVRMQSGKALDGECTGPTTLEQVFVCEACTLGGDGEHNASLHYDC